MTNGLLIYEEIFRHFLIYIRKPFFIYDLATAPLWISLHIRKIWFFFYQCTTDYCADIRSAETPTRMPGRAENRIRDLQCYSANNPCTPYFLYSYVCAAAHRKIAEKHDTQKMSKKTRTAMWADNQWLVNDLLKVLSSHLNWGARLDSFDTLLNSRWPASLKKIF